MRIAILTTVHRALDARIFYKEAVSLRSNGHSVDLFAKHDAAALPIATENGICLHGLLNRSGMVGRVMRILQLCSLLFRYRNIYDVWHFHDPELLLICVLLATITRARSFLVYDAHEDLPLQILSKPWIPQWFRPTVSRLVRYSEGVLARRIRLIFAATDTIANRFRANGCHDVETLRNYPVINPTLDSNPRKVRNLNELRLIYVGGISQERGVTTLIDSMKQLRDEPISATLVGRFFTKQLESEIRLLAPKSVKVVGEISHREVASFLADSDVGLVTLWPIESYMQSLPIKLFEYMYAGLAVIASDFPQWREIVDESQCGVLVDPRNSQSLADTIRWLLHNPDEVARMGAAGRQAVLEQYNWNVESVRMMRSYERLNASANVSA